MATPNDAKATSASRPSQQPVTAIVDSSANLKAVQFQSFLDKFRPQLERLIAKKYLNAEKMIGLVLRAFTSNEDLRECTALSIVNSMMLSAQLGLECNTPLGHAYLIPFNNKVREKGKPDRWEKACSFQIGYKGLIELSLRSGAVHDVKPRLVYQADEFSLVYSDRDELTHKPFLGSDEERGDWYLAYNRVRFKTGDPSFDWMSKQDVMYVKDQSSKAGTVWGTWEESMAEKTVLKKHLKFLKLTEDVDRAIGLDDQVFSGEQDKVIDVTGTGQAPARIFAPAAPPQQKPSQNDPPDQNFDGMDSGGFDPGGEQQQTDADTQQQTGSATETKVEEKKVLTVDDFTADELTKITFELKTAGRALNRAGLIAWLANYFPDDKAAAMAKATELYEAKRQGGAQ